MREIRDIEWNSSISRANLSFLLVAPSEIPVNWILVYYSFLFYNFFFFFHNTTKQIFIETITVNNQEHLSIDEKSIKRYESHFLSLSNYDTNFILNFTSQTSFQYKTEY